MSERWEQSLQEWYESRKSHLKYLDLEDVSKPSTSQLAHNLSIIRDNTNLHTKVLLKHCYVLEEKIENLQKQIIVLEKGLEALTAEFLASRPLTIKQVKDLVVEIAEQPKLVEREALRLTADLQGKVDKALQGTSSLSPEGAEGFARPSGRTQSSLDTIIRQNNTKLFLLGRTEDLVLDIREELVEVRRALAGRKDPDISELIEQIKGISLTGRTPEPRGVLLVEKDPYLTVRKELNEKKRGRSGHRGSPAQRGGSEPPRRTDPP
nr:ORF1 protein [Ipomoea batatas]